jgi:hypothetical protein
VVVSRPSFAKGKLADSLAEAFLALEEDMKNPSNRHELLCLSRGEHHTQPGHFAYVVAATATCHNLPERHAATRVYFS